MARLGRRLAMATVGALLLVLYLGVGALGYRLAVALWAARPDLPTTLAAVVVASALFGYVSYRFGTARLLSSLDAAPLARERAPEAHRRLDGLVERMDVSRPRLLVGQLGAPNALAVGSGRNGALVVDASLFRLLSPAELEALFAHELAHLEGRDSLIQSLVHSLGRTLAALALVPLAPVVWLLGGVARAVALLRGRPTSWPENPLGRLQRRLGQAALLLLVAVTLAVLAHSRRREYAADDRAAAVSDPLALASALDTISRAAEPGWGLLSPLYVHGDDEGPLTRLLSTHPPLDERIERLQARAANRARPV